MIADWILKALPFKWYAIGAVALLMLSTIFVQYAEIGHLTTKLAVEQRDRAEEKQRATAAALAQTEHFRTVEQARVTAHKEISDESQRMSSRNRAAAVVRSDSSVRLSQRIDATVAAHGEAAGHPGVAEGGTPAEDPLVLLAGLLKQADERSGLLAEYADEARTAGLTCERAYDALNEASEATKDAP